MTEHRATYRTRRRGFTLIELLVALGIFLIVIGSVAAVFALALRTSKQGFQNQQAFEVARGALDVMERDLSRAFTSREHGDLYNFYGTPIGFTFVGVVPVGDSGEINLARVTYVVRQTVTDLPLTTVDEEERQVFSLIRYAEPGEEDLDSFPIEWNDEFLPDVANPITLQQFAEQEAFATPAFVPPRCLDQTDTKCLDALILAKRRELWIRMLAGDPTVPDGWGLIGEDPLDYVVAENILPIDRTTKTYSVLTPSINDNHLASVANPPFPEAPVLDTAQVPPSEYFFTYEDVFRVPQFDAFGNLIGNVVRSVPLAYWNDVRNVDTQNLWFEAAILNLFTNDSLGLTTEERQELVSELNVEDFALGSPLDARLPQQLTVQLVLFFEAPAPGAPDFNREFVERIDLHAGYRRLPK